MIELARSLEERPVVRMHEPERIRQYRPRARSFAGRISRHVVHQPVRIVSMNSGGGSPYTPDEKSVARFLDEHPAVAWVAYAGLPSSPSRCCWPAW